MFNRENAIGVVLLILCAAVALFLLYLIATGQRAIYTGPDELIWVLAGVFVIGAIWLWIKSPRRWL